MRKMKQYVFRIWCRWWRMWSNFNLARDKYFNGILGKIGINSYEGIEDLQTRVHEQCHKILWKQDSILYLFDSMKSPFTLNRDKFGDCEDFALFNAHIIGRYFELAGVQYVFKCFRVLLGSSSGHCIAVYASAGQRRPVELIISNTFVVFNDDYMNHYYRGELLAFAEFSMPKNRLILEKVEYISK